MKCWMLNECESPPPPWGLWPQAVASSFATTKNIKTKVALMLKMPFNNNSLLARGGQGEFRHHMSVHT